MQLKIQLSADCWYEPGTPAMKIQLKLCISAFLHWVHKNHFHLKSLWTKVSAERSKVYNVKT